MNNMSSIGIYRAVSENKKVSNTLFKPYPTMRPPGNVPYIVDNLWEWKRPDEFPNRRFSAFASPTPELAIEAVGGNSNVYKVEFNGVIKKTGLCQVVPSNKIRNPEDSKFHPECKVLKKLLIKKLGHNWFGKDISEKQKIASLWMPCLKKEEVEVLFQSAEELRRIRDEIYDSIQYWNDVVLFENTDNVPDHKGELFFEYLNGYYLRPL